MLAPPFVLPTNRPTAFIVSTFTLISIATLGHLSYPIPALIQWDVTVIWEGVTITMWLQLPVALQWKMGRFLDHYRRYWCNHCAMVQLSSKLRILCVGNLESKCFYRQLPTQFISTTPFHSKTQLCQRSGGVFWHENVRALLYLTKTHHLSGLFLISILKVASKNCMERTALHWHYTVHCGCTSYITLGCLWCGWGSGRLGAGALLKPPVKLLLDLEWPTPATSHILDGSIFDVGFHPMSGRCF